MTRILVVEPELEAARTLDALVAGMTDEPVGHTVAVRDAIERAEARAVDVVVLGLGIEVEEALAAVAAIAEQAPTVSTIVVRPHVTTDLLRRAIRAGAADVCGTDDAASELSDAIERALRHSALLQEAALQQDIEKPRRGTVVTVFSTKGGVGKSVLSTNLGVALATLGKSVVLVDLDLQFGDVGIMLGLEPTLTISGPAQASDRLDTELLAGYLIPHSSGLKCLLAPVMPEEAEAITPGRIARVLELLSEMFDAVIVDTCASLDETVLTALDRSDRVLAITMMDVASIKNTRISLQKLHQLGYDGQCVEVVLNRADSKVFLQTSQVEKAIGREISVQIPSDRIVPQSVNKGVPVVLESPRSDVARALMGIANQVAQVQDKAVSGSVA